MIYTRILLYFALSILFLWNPELSAQGCAGLDADAGPDQFTCDPSQPVQLMGSFNGSPTKYYWTPTTWLSDPNATDPIVNAPPGKYKYTFTVEAISPNNLIVNGNFESGNSGFTHDYNYGTPGGTFGPGWLSVGTTPPAYNGGWANCGDHTTGSGNQLIVDGHTTPNSNVWCQTVSVTSGRTYLFRFFVQSVYPVAPPNLIAKANNVTFGNVSGAGLCDWQMFEACFTANSGSVRLCIQETSNIGFGNDFTIDDIQLYEKCMDSDEVEVEVVDLKARIDVPKLPRCASDIFDLNAIGSSAGPNISYQWSSAGGRIVSQAGLSAKGQGRGTYTVKVTYRNGNVLCEQEAEIEVDPADDLEGSIEVQGIANCNNDTIVLRAEPINGSGNYTYLWIPANKIHRGKNDPTAYVTEAGLYKVVIIDSDSGCELELQDIVVSDTTHPSANLTGDTLIDCRKPFANLIGSPFDTTKFSYFWTLPDSSVQRNRDSIQTRTAGIYHLRVVDKANKCFSDRSINIRIDTSAPIIELGPDLVIDCIQTDVEVDPVSSPGTPPVDYFWTLPSGTLPVEKNLLPKKVNQPGKVLLRIVNPGNGCAAADSLNIQDLRQLPPAEAGMGSTLNCLVTDLVLNGAGTRTDSTKYFWSTRSGNILSGANTLNPNINAPGWYFITVEDTANHCINTDSVFIDQNILAPDAALGPDLVFTCADTLVTIDGSATSSSGNPLLYFWYSVNGLIDQGQGTLRIQVKSPGEYFLIATDSLNGCADTAMISITPDLNLPVAAILAPDTLNCIRNTIQLNGMANSPAGNPISFRWTSGAGQNIQNPNSLNPGITEAGDYFLTVIDQVNGCSTTVKTVVVIDTIKPLAIAGPDQVWNCRTKQLMLDASGSSGNHSLLFDWTTPDGVILSSPSNSQILAGAAGTYFLTVVDPVNGCVSSDQLSLTPDLQAPIATIASADTLNCIRSIITIRGSGSSSGNRIQYQWTTTNGQIISPADQPDIQVNQAGIYLLLVVDTTNHCRDSQNVVIIEDKILPLVQAGPDTQLDCQTTDLVLSGMVGNPSGSERFSWTTLQGNMTGRTDSIQVGVNKAGTYILQVTNSRNGCSQSDTLVVRFVNNLSVDAGPSLELTCSILQGDLTGSITNGNGAETIQWTTLQGRFAGATNGPRATIDRPGVYYFRVNNSLTGCSGLDSVVVTENTNRPTDLQLSVQQPKCPGDSWFADLSQITGGVPPYRYFLDNNPNPGTIFQGQTPGNHNIRILDANGCPLDRSFVITDPLPVSVQIQPVVKLQAGDSYALQPLYSIPDDSIDWVSWSPSDFLLCNDCKYPTARAIDRNIEYIVTFANKNGCTASARIRIEVIRRNIWIPNAFSPNGDNINDSFFPVVSEESFNEIRNMQIFDRWGNLVYSASHFPPNDPAYGWTGESGGDKLNPGVFVYLIELEWKNGEVEKFFGDLSLIR